MSSERTLRVLVELASSDLRVGAVNDALDLAHYARTSSVQFFFCGAVDPALAGRAASEGVKFISGRSRMISKKSALLYGLSVLVWVGRLLRLRPHVVHLNYTGYAPSLACASRCLRIPVVVRAGADYVKTNLLNNWAAAYVANGEAHARALMESPLAPRVRITGDLFRPERLTHLAAERFIPARTSRTRFLFVGQLVERKGITVLVEAFSRIRADADLLLVGGNWQTAGYPELVRRRLGELNLASRVHCENHRQDVAALLHDCDVFVLPSLSEARPRVVIEAMLMGRPVIASRVGGLPELVADGVTGILVEPGDPQALAAALEHLVDAAALRERLGTAGRERALKEFKPERAAGRYVALYRELAGP